MITLSLFVVLVLGKTFLLAGLRSEVELSTVLETEASIKQSDHAVFLELEVVPCETVCDKIRKACRTNGDAKKEYVTRTCLALKSNGSAAATCEHLKAGKEQNCCQCLVKHPEEISATCHHMRPQIANSQQILGGELSFVAHTLRFRKGRLVLRHAFAEEDYWSSECIQFTKGDLDLGGGITATVTFINQNDMQITLRVINLGEVQTRLQQHQEKAAAEMTNVARMIMSGKTVIDKGGSLGTQQVFWTMMQKLSDVNEEIWYSQERKVEVVCKKLERLFPDDVKPDTDMALFKQLLQFTRGLAGIDWIPNFHQAKILRDALNNLPNSCPVPGIDPCEWLHKEYNSRAAKHKHVVSKLLSMVDKIRPYQTKHATADQKLKNSKVAVVGGGPVGLFAAFSAALAFQAEGSSYDIDVFEMRVDFYRGNGLTLWPATAKFLVDVGWEDLMPFRSLKFVRDPQNFVGTRAAQIAATQRFFWRLGLFLGVRTNFLSTFLGVCRKGESSWEALVAPTRCGIDHLDEKGSCWLKTPRYDTTKDTLCKNPPPGTKRFPFDVLVGADGTRSTTRALIPEVGWQEDAAPRFYGMTFTYHLISGQSCTPSDTVWRAWGAMFRGKIKLATPYELAPYCYTSVVFSKGEGERLKKYSIKGLQWWIKRWFQVHPSRLNIQPNGKPDIAFLNVKLASASQIGGFKDGSPPILLAGDSYAPGFYFLGNGFNGGVARLQKLWQVGHLPEFIRAIDVNKTQDFISAYTSALGDWGHGGVGNSEVQREWNQAIADSLMSAGGLLGPTYLWNQREYLNAKKDVDEALKVFTDSLYQGHG